MKTIENEAERSRIDCEANDININRNKRPIKNISKFKIILQ